MSDVFLVRPTPTPPGLSSYWWKSARSSEPIPRNLLVRSCLQFNRLLFDVVAGRSQVNSRDLALPLRPISKARPRSFRGQARPYTDRVYKDWLKDARMHLSEWWVEPPLEHVQMMDVHFYGPARGDLDNRVGAVCDAMNGIVIKDDNVNVLPRMRLAFTKAKAKDARIYIRLLWGEA